MAVRGDIRNVAIVAHVDHGKTTLVNAMLAQSHVFNEREEVPDRVMDSNDLEREKGITILAKNTAVQYTGPLAAKYGHPEGITLNIIDTPGHADFGGEVERGISMVDGVVLLVDASEGPLPQTRFVLRKALEAKLPVILCVNKTDRPDARIEEVVGESSDLLLGLAQDVIEEGVDLDEDALFDLPVIYCAAKAGYASENQPENGGLPDNDNLEPLFEAIIKNIPAPEYEEGAPLQAHVANIDSSDFLGRLGLVRIYNGTLEKGKTYGLSRVDGSVENFRVSELLRTQGLERTPVDSAGPGDIVAVAGVNDIMIGETIVDPSDPRPLPLIHVDDPAISMTFGINDSPLAGTEGKDHKLTARMIKDRLDRELIGNVSIKVLPTERPDAWEVQGRGELAPRSGQRNMQRQGSYRGRSDNNRGRMPQGTGRGGSNRGRGGGRAPQNNGLDPRIAYAGIGAVALLLIVLIVVLLRGCGSSAPESTPETPVATKTTTKKSSNKTESVDEDEDTDETTDESTDSDAAKTTAKKEENEVTKVKISVAKGKTAWIEVKVDGKSVYGAQATGPFEQEYTPESSIEITTSKPSDVTVTKNGEKVRYDTKTSGVARVTITVPKKETTDSEDGESTDGTDDANSADGTEAQSTEGTNTATDGQTTTDSTDYSYDSY